ncbi:MAG TPA: CHASE3 domain-containing protein, partial [Acidimicrobiales bacterium]|nr:CHASE3 domain-containing protein [Acidimicrobiales bacterium]
MSPIGGRTAAPPRRSRPLVWLVALLSSCAIGAGSLAVVMVMSVARHVADAEGEIGGIGEMATLVAEQASDERGFLLTGDRTFVDAFDAKTKRIVGLRDALGGTVSTDEQRAIDAALGPYHRYVGLHQSVVELRGAGRTDDAVALSFGPAANALQDARAKFDAARKVVVENSDRELSAAHRDGLLLSLVLVLLGFVPGLAAFALSRSQRRLVIE